jgi:hypothetical protein
MAAEPRLIQVATWTETLAIKVRLWVAPMVHARAGESELRHLDSRGDAMEH